MKNSFELTLEKQKLIKFLEMLSDHLIESISQDEETAIFVGYGESPIKDYKPNMLSIFLKNITIQSGHLYLRIKNMIFNGNS